MSEYDPFKFSEDDAVEILVIADRSGSMAGIEDDAVGGFNTFLKEQKSVEGAANLTLVLFDDQYEIKLDSVPLTEVRELDSLGPRGMTAMNDAIGRSLARLFERNPKKAIICVITDGMENASREYDNAKIKEMIQKAENDKGWQVVYLAANQDAFEEGASRGITKSFNYDATGLGVRSAYNDMSATATSYRANVTDSAVSNN